MGERESGYKGCIEREGERGRGEDDENRVREVSKPEGRL